MTDYFGIGRRTFYSMMQRDEEIAAQYKRGKAKAIGVIAQGLINKDLAGDTTSMIFFLKAQAGWRETSQVEHMLPAEPEISSNSAFRKLSAYLDAIRSRQKASVLTAEPVAVPLHHREDQDG